MLKSVFSYQPHQSDHDVGMAPHEKPSAAIALSFIFIIFLAVSLRLFDISTDELSPIFGLITVVLVFGYLLKYFIIHDSSGHPWTLMKAVSDFLIIIGIFYLIVATAALSCWVVALIPFPFADNALAAADNMLGFNWPAMIARFEANPNAANILIKTYATLNWQPQLAILLLCFCRNRLEAYRFITAWGLCLLFTIMVFLFFPSASAFNYYQVDPTLLPGGTSWASWHVKELIEGLRSGGNTILGTADLTGIISMPSFHAASAVLLAFAFWPFKWLRWPFAALNITMFLSAIPVGGHYLVDVLAGLVLAVLAILCAIRIHDRIARPASVEFRGAQPAFA